MTHNLRSRFLAGGSRAQRLLAIFLAAGAFSATHAVGITALSQAEVSPATQTSARDNSVEIIVLEPGKPMERELAGGQRDIFQIVLSGGQHASVVIEHGGLDLTVQWIDPEKMPMVEAESTPGEARDIFEVVAQKSGPYQIEVEPRYPKAIAGKYHIRVAEIRAATEMERNLEEARREYSQSWQLYRIGAYDKAQIAAERALAVREKALSPDQTQLVASLNRLGVTCSARADYNRGEESLQRASAIAEKAFGKDSLASAEIADSLAQNYNGKADYAEAERLGKRALGIRERSLGADHFLVAASLGTLGDIYLAKGDYANASAFSERALEITGKSYPPESLPYADASSRLARVQVRQGAYSSGEQLLIQAFHTREVIAGKDSLPVSDSLTDLGSLYLLKGDNLKSEQFLQQALPIKERILGPDHLQVGLILHNLGTIYYRRGDSTTAKTFYQRSLDIKEKALGPSHPLTAYTLNNLGLIYWHERNYPKAKEFFQRTLEICEAAYGPDSPDVAFPLGNLGIIAKETGDYDRAEAYYKRVLAIREKALGIQHPLVGTTLESLAILYRDKGDYVTAEPLFRRVLAITQASLGMDHPDNARHYRNLEHLYAAKGDVANALQCLQHIREIEEKNLPLNLAIGSERQKLAYFGPMEEDLEKIISFHVQQDASQAEARDLAASALLQRKGRVLDAMADSLETLWNRSNAEDRALLGQLKDVTSKLASLVLTGPQGLSISEQQERIKTLTQRREAIENEAGRRSAGYFQGTQTVTLAAVKSALPADAVLIEFAVYRPFDPTTPNESTKSFGEPRYIAYVIPNRGEVRWKDLGSAKDIDNAVDAFRQALRDPERADVKQLSRAVDDKVMEPVRALAGGATHLLVSPDGQLDLVPFEALLDEQGRYMVERFSITYLTTGRDLLRMQLARESKSGPLVIADPAFGEPKDTTLARADHPNLIPRATTSRRRSITTGQDLSAVYFAPLSGTAQEARAIQSLFPAAQILTGTQASKTALKQVVAPSILHIATHGFFLQDAAAAGATPDTGKLGASDTRAIRASARIENPLLRSGLALSGANLSKTGNEDGILTALEAANLNLWGTKLVTLSACETGVGEVRNGEGVYGLRRSFFLAGAETLVMSLWPVSDRVTREMMTAYYTGLKKGLGRGEALRQAELTMFRRKGRQHPFYWASFIQSGEWANLNGKR